MFLIQTVDNEVCYDFSFQLIEAIKYNNWFRHDKIFEYVLVNDIPNYFIEDCIPIGTVEFVHKYLKKYYNIIPKPLNVPEELFKYANREIENTTNEELWGKGELFVKSNDTVKEGITGIYNTNLYTLPKGNYQASEIIEVKSEWRAFVYYNKLVGLQHYSGDFTKFPDINKINNMIKDYKNSPNAYTLDVGLIDGITDSLDTIVIECHNFYSCGLYGFSDNTLLPYMFSKGFYQIVKNKS